MMLHKEEQYSVVYASGILLISTMASIRILITCSSI